MFPGKVCYSAVPSAEVDLDLVSSFINDDTGYHRTYVEKPICPNQGCQPKLALTIRWVGAVDIPPLIDLRDDNRKGGTNSLITRAERHMSKGEFRDTGKCFEKAASSIVDKRESVEPMRKGHLWMETSQRGAWEDV